MLSSARSVEALETRQVETSRGTVFLRGRLGLFRPDRPLLFVIRGAFPTEHHLEGLADDFPDADIAFAHLPGMWSPPFDDPSIDAFAGAFDEVIERELPDRRVNILGVSIGGAVGLAMRHPRLRSLLACDTPLKTAHLWPLADTLREYCKTPRLAAWIWAVFGFAPDLVEERDYTRLLEGRRIPTRILVGEDPLGSRRPISRLPSLVSEEDRGAFRAAGCHVQVVLGAGHAIPKDAGFAVKASLREALRLPPDS